MDKKVCKDCKYYGKPCKQTNEYVARKKEACDKYKDK